VFEQHNLFEHLHQTFHRRVAQQALARLVLELGAQFIERVRQTARIARADCCEQCVIAQCARQCEENVADRDEFVRQVLTAVVQYSVRGAGEAIVAARLGQFVGRLFARRFVLTLSFNAACDFRGGLQLVVRALNVHDALVGAAQILLQLADLQSVLGEFFVHSLFQRVCLDNLFLFEVEIAAQSLSFTLFSIQLTRQLLNLALCIARGGSFQSLNLFVFLLDLLVQSRTLVLALHRD
jgi:hypothetical protein